MNETQRAKIIIIIIIKRTSKECFQTEKFVLQKSLMRQERFEKAIKEKWKKTLMLE